MNLSPGALLTRDDTFNASATQIKFDDDFKPHVVFNYNYYNYSYLNCFLQQRPTQSGTQWLRTYRCYAFDKQNLSAINSTDYLIKGFIKGNETIDNSTLMNNISGTQEVLAIFQQIIEKRFQFLYESNKTIEYCFTKDKRFIDEVWD